MKCIIVDERIKNLKDIEKNLLKQKVKVKFLGLEYKGALMQNASIPTENEFKAFWNKFANKVKSSKKV